MKKLTGDKLVFTIISFIFILVVALLCLVPFVLVLAGSFESQDQILLHGYGFIPREFTLDAYKTAFLNPEGLINSYTITITVTVIGTLLGLFTTAMTAYVLSRKDFEWRNKFSFFFYFTTILNGGLVPWYILCVRYLKLNDNILGLLLPFMLSVFNILVMKSFMNSIPEAISESGKIDGANDFRIFTTLILPLSKPALATIGLFIALMYWNDWFLSYIFMQNSKLFSLQYYLYKIVAGAEALKKLTNVPGRENVVVPTESLKLAMTIISTGPIILLYPFVQKYFVSGLTIGAVKG
ncbi:MAG: sugar transporter permease [Eubacterium sp.]|nr:sugar transporter permease [Eubacterium sp.]